MTPDTSRVNDSSDNSDTAKGDTKRVIDATGGSGTSNTGWPASAEPDFVRRASLARRLWPPLFLLFLVACIVLVWLMQDRILDSMALRGYVPPADIQKVARQATFTPYAERLFYVNKPAIEEKDTFNKNCPDESEQVAVLGCYTGDRRGIHIYNVTDSRLDGVVQVTAAHEMLHQAYDRLGTKERARINDLLTAYATTITDQDMLKKLSEYQNLESTEVLNEEHSLFGTEVSSLPPELETYYARYFTNRSQVIAYHVQSRAAFSERQAKIDEYDVQIKQLKTDIDSQRAQIDTTELQLKQSKAQMDAWLAAGQLDTYNDAVPQFNAAVASYRRQLDAFNSLVEQYNDILEKRGKIALQEEELQKAQDSQASSVDTK